MVDFVFPDMVETCKLEQKHGHNIMEDARVSDTRRDPASVIIQYTVF